MSKFKIILTPQGEGLPRYDVHCECGNRISIMWASETEDSKTIAPECEMCGNKGHYIIHMLDGDWIVEGLE